MKQSEEQIDDTHKVSMARMNECLKRIKQIANVKYSVEKDPLFYLFVERLEKAKELKETYRVDAVQVLGDFISGEKSLRY